MSVNKHFQNLCSMWIQYKKIYPCIGKYKITIVNQLAFTKSGFTYTSKWKYNIQHTFENNKIPNVGHAAFAKSRFKFVFNMDMKM